MSLLTLFLSLSILIGCLSPGAVRVSGPTPVPHPVQSGDVQPTPVVPLPSLQPGGAEPAPGQATPGPMPSSPNAGGAAGGGGGGGGGAGDTASAVIVLNHERLNRVVGKAVQLSATLHASAGTTGTSIAWESSNASVAEVSASGLVTMKATGTATITASLVGSTMAASAFCDVTVAATRQPLSVMVAPTSVVMNTVGNLPLAATVTYNDDTTDHQVVWSSFASAIASVAANGTLTAHRVGGTVVRAAATDGTAWLDVPVTIGAPVGNRAPHSLTVVKDLGTPGDFPRTIQLSNAQAVDPDGDPLIFTWEKIGTFGQLAATTGTATALTVTAPGRYAVRLMARDPYGQTVSIVVSDDLD